MVLLDVLEGDEHDELERLLALLADDGLEDDVLLALDGLLEE